MRKAAAPITGGMSWPPVDPTASIAAAICAGNPERFISGMVTTPTAETFATALPEIMPKNAEPTTATLADLQRGAEQRVGVEVEVDEQPREIHRPRLEHAGQVMSEHAVDHAAEREPHERHPRHAPRALEHEERERRRHQDTVERPHREPVGELGVGPGEVQAQREAAEGRGEIPPPRRLVRDEEADRERDAE